jgi:hypothetical protein
MDDMHTRLVDARLAAGFLSKRKACEAHSWAYSTYSAHENGQNKYNAQWALEYAKAYNTTPEWLLLGGLPDAPAQISTGIDARLKELPETQAKKLIDRFNAMIDGMLLAGKID